MLTLLKSQDESDDTITFSARSPPTRMRALFLSFFLQRDDKKAVILQQEIYLLMNGKMLRQRIKPWMLPIAMLAGVLLHDYIDSVAFLTPWLIFVMLLVTFCRIDPRHIGFSRMIWMLLGVQIAGAVLSIWLSGLLD